MKKTGNKKEFNCTILFIVGGIVFLIGLIGGMLFLDAIGLILIGVGIYLVVKKKKEEKAKAKENPSHTSGGAAKSINVNWHSFINKNLLKTKRDPKTGKWGTGVSKDDILSLTYENGEEAEFVVIAGIAYQGSFYVILQPMELETGMDADEGFLFKVTPKGDGSNNFTIVLDEHIIDAAFKEYNKMLDKAIKEGN